MSKIDLLKRYSIISLLSTASVKGIFANDVQLVYGYDFDVFKFKDNGKEYYFKFNNIIINGNRYTLTENEKLADLVLQKLLPACEKQIENIKQDIIVASKQKEFNEKDYKELIFKTSITKLYRVQVGNGSYLKVIKDNRNYYKDFLSLEKGSPIDLEDAFRTEIWKEDTYSCHDLYVVNSIRINNNSLAKVIKDITSISEARGKEIAHKLESFCSNKISIESFEYLNKETDFKDEIIRKFKNSDDYIYYWEVDRALASGYLDKILADKVKELDKERKSILDYNETFKLKVKFYDNKNLDFEYEYFDVTPQTTYADLYEKLLKKCAENLKTTEDYLYAHVNINGAEIEDIDVKTDAIKLDISECTLHFYKSEYKKSDADEKKEITLCMASADSDDEDSEDDVAKKAKAKKEKEQIEASIKENEDKLKDDKQLISAIKIESEIVVNSATEIKLDIKQDELDNVVNEIRKEKENKEKKKNEEIKKEGKKEDKKEDKELKSKKPCSGK